MQLRSASAVIATALLTLAAAAPAAHAARDPLNAYRVAPTAENKQKLARAGYDLIEADKGAYLEVFGTAEQAKTLSGAGLAPKLVGKVNSATSQAADVPVGSDAAFNVWRRYDKVPTDTKEQYLELYDRLEGMSIVKKVALGKTHLGRDLIALKVTQNAKTRTDNTRPAVLYNAMQHAREWLAGETCRRTLLYFTSNYGKDTDAGREVTELVNTRELWFMCVNNPDGYEYTFTEGNRLWRKNMSDNNGNGIRGEAMDGVDVNRNHATHWGYDNEGSSEDPLSETFRGTGPDSEPETKALKKLWSMVDFKFEKNDHTAAELLLWPNGFQQYTPTPDDKLFEAYAGDDANSAIADKVFNAETEEWEITGNRFDPDIGAELYITNGDLTDDAYANGILGLHPRRLRAQHPERLGLRVPGRRGGHRAGVPAPQAVRARPREVGRRPGQPDLTHGQHGRELLRRELRGLLRRPAAHPGRGQEVARRRQAALPDQRRRGEDRRDRPVHRAASATTTSPASTTSACAAR